MNRYGLILILLLLAFSFSCVDQEPAEPPEETAPETEVPEDSGLVDEVPAEIEAEPEPDEEAEPEPAPTPVDKPSEIIKVNPALMNPSLAKERAPEKFRVKFDTTKGSFTVEVDRSWAPRGADRFYNLVKIGFFQDIAFFRVLDGFVAQFGISGDPRISEKWRDANIKDEPVLVSNTRGFVTYAKGGPDTRSTQFFINLADNVNLDQMGFPPFGKVVEGMSVVDSLYSGYGEGAPRGRGPSQGLIQSQGNNYLNSQFSKLDYIKTASLLN
jgi:peptidyl-prolyl cis-trans isomerase A (cyclophilin A)